MAVLLVLLLPVLRLDQVAVDIDIVDQVVNQAAVDIVDQVAVHIVAVLLVLLLPVLRLPVLRLHHSIYIPFDGIYYEVQYKQEDH